MGNFVEGVVHDTDKHGQGNEEGRDEEGDEKGDEEDRCNWKTCEAARLPWISREDQRRIEEGQVDQEQGWQSCERSDEQGWQKKLCAYSWMDEGRTEGSRRLEG